MAIESKGQEMTFAAVVLIVCLASLVVLAYIAIQAVRGNLSFSDTAQDSAEIETEESKP